MKKAIIIVICSLLFTACTKKEELIPPKVYNEKNEEIQNVGENIPISRGTVARIISLCFSTTEQINAINDKIIFNDISKTHWCYYYVNEAVDLGYMAGSGKEFKPDSYLTVKEFNIILENIFNVKTNVVYENENSPVSINLFTELFFENLKKDFESLEIKEENVAVFATTENGNNQPWKISTSKGILDTKGLSTDVFIDKTIHVLLKNDEIISIIDVVENEIEIEKCFFEKNDNGISISYQGGKRDFQFTGEILSNMANVTIKDGEITEISFIDN